MGIYKDISEFKHRKLDWHDDDRGWSDGDIMDAHKQGWEEGYSFGMSDGVKNGRAFERAERDDPSLIAEEDEDVLEDDELPSDSSDILRMFREYEATIAELRNQNRTLITMLEQAHNPLRSI